MKTFIGAVLTLTLLTGAVIWNNIYIKKTTTDLLEACEKLPEHVPEIPEGDASDFKAAIRETRDVWERSRFLICLSVNHAEADAIDEALGETEVYYLTGDKSGYANACRALKEKIRTLRRSESLSLEGIL